jgi:pimeloyl-ACP methyl ester carboxylesterase
MIEGFFFSDNRLFGIYRPPAPESTPRQHVVTICDAVLHEYFKTQFVARQLAKQLSEAGYDVLRFDYSGQGNSDGEISAKAWRDNVAAAVDEALSISGAETISLVGFRFGGLLACRYSGPHAVDRVALWDPILNGATFVEHLRRVHAGLLKAHRGMTARDRERALAEELVGYRMTNGFVDSLAREHIEGAAVTASSVWVVRSESEDEGWDGYGGDLHIHGVPYVCQWGHHNSRLLFAHDVVARLKQCFA